MASERGWIDSVIALRDKGADINAVSKVRHLLIPAPPSVAFQIFMRIFYMYLLQRGASAMMMAAVFGHLEIVKYLVGCGADLTVQNTVRL